MGINEMKPLQDLYVTHIDGEYENRKKYVLFRGKLKEEMKTCFSVFVRLLEAEIYVDGFTSDDEDYIDMVLFRKKVFAINTLEKDAAIFVWNDIQYENSDVNICKVALIINPYINKNNVVIYGAGQVGREVCLHLQRENYMVKAFVDSDASKEGMDIYGVPVINKRFIRDMEADTSIIEASIYFVEMDRDILNIRHDIQRFYEFFLEKVIWSMIRIWDENKKSKSINLFGSTLYLFFYAMEKKIFIYDRSVTGQKYATLLKLLNIDFGGFVGKSGCSGEILNVEDILYEENFFILIIENQEQVIKQMENLGLTMQKHFGTLETTDYNCNLDYRYILDAQLGVTSYDIKKKTMGFSYYGNDNAKYKVVGLGGSTTDGMAYTIPSWPEILWENTSADIQIINGGVRGYTSSQEMLKLLRDVINLQPHMIIVFDGVNDAILHNQESAGSMFEIPMITRVFEYAKNALEGWNMCKGVVNYGGKANLTAFERWLSNLEFMHSVCECRNIVFHAFLQPMFASKANKNKEEIASQMCTPGYWNRCHESQIQFRQQMTKLDIEKIYPYIHDLSHIFDHEFNIFWDGFHATKRGNEIIATEIWKIIESNLVN